MPSRKGELIGYSADSHGGYRVLMDATTGERAESTDVIFHEATEVPGGGGLVVSMPGNQAGIHLSPQVKV